MIVRIAPCALALILVVRAASPSTVADELAVQHPLDDDAIADALALGRDVSKKLPRLHLGSAGSNFAGMRDDSNRNNSFAQQQKSVRTSGFGVEVYSPYGWLAKLARDAAMKGQEMLPRHVSELHVEPVLRVVCHADVPQEFRVGAFGNPVASATIVSPNKKVTEPLQPVSTMRIPDKFRAPSGELVDVGPLVASFDLGQLLQLSARDKKGEFFVAITAENGETKRFKVKSKHFRQLP